MERKLYGVSLILYKIEFIFLDLKKFIQSYRWTLYCAGVSVLLLERADVMDGGSVRGATVALVGLSTALPLHVYVWRLAWDDDGLSQTLNEIISAV